MSKIALSGNASGTGTLTISAPNTSTDRTLTLPDQTGTLLTGSGAIGVNSSAATNSLVIDASGNVGIGTSSPATKLDVSGKVKVTAIELGASEDLTTNLYYSGGWKYRGTGYGTVIGAASGAITFSNTASSGSADGAATVTERARIDSSGNLLVGTTTDASSTTAGVKIKSPLVAYSAWSCGSTTSEIYQIGFINGNGLVGRISTNGSATSYVTSSDYRLKNNIEPMTGALAKVIALKPCTYKWNADDSDGEGFIAHELAEVCPQAVSGEKDAVDAEGNPQYQGIDTSFLVATLTAAIQELKAIVDAQGAEIAALKGTA